PLTTATNPHPYVYTAPRSCYFSTAPAHPAAPTLSLHDALPIYFGEISAHKLLPSLTMPEATSPIRSRHDLFAQSYLSYAPRGVRINLLAGQTLSPILRRVPQLRTISWTRPKRPYPFTHPWPSRG